jgi:membrane protease subunit HflK
VTRENQLNVGYAFPRPGSDAVRDVPEESLMLTGDENIVDINFTVFWVIRDAGDFLFNVQSLGTTQDLTIRAVAESAMREVVGRNEIEPILTANREPIQEEVRELMQRVLDSYGAGVTITRVQMQKADPPQQVLEAYRDVQAAVTDQDRMRNEAEAYANRVVPEARGGAARIIQQAEGYKQQVVAQAQGEAQRFVAVFDQYKRAPDVTRRRIYLETMQDILSNMNKVILDNRSGQGVVPYLPLPELQRQGRTGPPVADASGARR